MAFLKEGKTNWKFLLIAVVLAVIVGGGILLYTAKQKMPVIQSIQINKTEEKTENIQKSITVISPNGGEQWKVGETYTIKWVTEGYNSTDPVEIVLKDTRYSGKAELLVETPIAEINNTGSFSWTIPSKLSVEKDPIDSPEGLITVGAGNVYKILIYIGEKGKSRGLDKSDNNFSITAGLTELYSNKNYGFEIKYPVGSQINEELGSIVINLNTPMPDRLNLLIKNLEIYINDKPVEKCPNEKDYKIIINNINFYWTKEMECEHGIRCVATRSYYTEHNNKCFEFIFNFAFDVSAENSSDFVDKECEIFNQILSTFRFLE